MTRKESTARRRAEHRGTASDFISRCIDVIVPGTLVVLCCRVSRDKQNRDGNLDDQERYLRQTLEAMGAVVVAVVRHVGPGTDLGWLARAAKLAKKHGAVLVAESTSRFCRHPGYHSSEWPDAQARESDLEDLPYFTEGVPLATLLHPDATPAKEKAFQTNRGRQMKGRTGGRPKKSERQKLLNAVWQEYKRLPT